MAARVEKEFHRVAHWVLLGVGEVDEVGGYARRTGYFLPF